MERRTVGSVEVIALVDTIQAYPATAVYPEAGEAVSRFSGYMDVDGKVALNFAAFVLIDGGTRVLVDTGWGPEFDGKLLEELAAAGIARDSIDAVIFTHLHGDHTGWNLDRATGQPLFAKATYLVPKGDWEHYGQQTPPPSSFVRDVLPLEAMKRMELVEGGRVLSPGLTTVATPGHTPGHTSVAIVSGGEHGFILGDVVISPIDAEEPDWSSSFDWDGAIARETRKKTIARLAANRSLVGSSHLPAPGFGRFAADGGKTRWAAE